MNKTDFEATVDAVNAFPTNKFRNKTIGGEGTEQPRVAQYVKRAFVRQSFRHAVYDWPKACGPSQHVPEKLTPHAKRQFFIDMVRGLSFREVFFGSSPQELT
ncbi:MAG: hypothetical protein AAGG55_02940 [Pseudomonadota bacterium]